MGDLFCNIIARLKATNAFSNVHSLEFKNTRLENKMGIDLLESLLGYGTELRVFDLTNYFVFFHHLMETQRQHFDWIIYSRINIVTHLSWTITCWTISC